MSDDAVAKAREAAIPETPLPGTSGAEVEAVAPKAAAPGEIPPIPEGLVGQQGASSIRPALRQTTPADLSRAWQAEMKRVTGRDIIVQIPPGASMATMGQYAEATVAMLERFPEMRLRKISWFDADGPHYARVRRGTATLEFNARWASEQNRRAYLSGLRNDVKGWSEPVGRGWSVRGASTPQATAYHELGHMLSIETFGGRLDSKALSIVHRRAVLEGIADDELVARDISAYAGSNAEEMIAEAFTDVVINGPAASQISRELYEMITDEYRRAGLALRTAPLAEGEFEGFTRVGLGEVFPKAAAPRALSSQTVAQLRALAKERGIAIPKGARKADLVKALEGRPSEPLNLTSAQEGASALRSTMTVQTALERAARARGPDALRARDFHRLESAIYDRETGYAGFGFFNTNRALQDARGLVPDAIRQQVEDIDRVIRLGTTENDVVLYRGLSRPDRFTGASLRIGDEFTEYGYSSTSVDLGHATDFARGRSALGNLGERPENPTVLRLIAPKGQPSVQISDLEFPGVGEVLLPRGLSYRVVADRGIVDGVRQLDVQIVQPGAVPVTERAAIRAAARERNRLIESSTSTGRLLAKVDELIAGKASKAIIRQELDPALLEAEQLYAGADRAIVDSLRAALDTGDPAKLRAALTRAGTKSKIKPVGRAGGKAAFDPETMEGVGGIIIEPGTPVTIVRRGSTLTLPDKTTMQIGRAQVTPVQPKVPPVKAVKAAPASRLATMKVADLRALAKERGIVIPAGARKADLVKALSGPGPAEAAVTRQAGIDAARAVGDLGAEVLELVDSGASARALRARIEASAKRLGTPDVVRNALLAQVDDASALRAAVGEQLGQAGVDTVGTAGKIVRFDRKTMDPIGGVKEGDWVVVDRPGTTLNREGEAIQLAKAKVSKASATEAAQARAEAESAVRDTYPARLAQTRKAAASKATAEPQHLGGGQTGTVTLVKRSDGTVVEKVYGQRYQMKPAEIKATVDAEVLGAPIVDAVGVRSAATTRLASDRIASEYLEGQTAAELWPDIGYMLSTNPRYQEYLAILDSDEGRLMGIADYLMYNIDRNPGNWVRMAGDRLGSFDLGSSFQLPEFRSPIKVPAGDFTEWLQDPTTRELTATVDIDPRDLAIIRARLEALRPQFTEASRSTWFNTMMRRLGELEKRAVGTRQRITP